MITLNEDDLQSMYDKMHGITHPAVVKKVGDVVILSSPNHTTSTTIDNISMAELRETMRKHSITRVLP